MQGQNDVALWFDFLILETAYHIARIPWTTSVLILIPEAVLGGGIKISKKIRTHFSSLWDYISSPG